ncbi:MAG: hypothetical protein LBE70_02410 [Nitrososphaerota archaeon]|jgi:ABC-type Fe3+-siderophore transport system permease subunit|nr:hypothetical protein [Nitrososphaerota archaeon]
MKSKFVYFAVIAFLIVSLCVLQPTQAQYTADGEPVIYVVGPLEIVTPVNTTYAINQVRLNFTVYAHFDPNVADVTITYSLNGADNVTIPTSSKYVPVQNTDAAGNPTGKPSTLFSYYTIYGHADITDLPQGSHSLTIFARYDDYVRHNVYFDDQTIHFTIDTINSPVTTNNDVNDIVSDHEVPKIIYAVIIIISLATATSFVLFTKHKPREKQKTIHS